MKLLLRATLLSLVVNLPTLVALLWYQGASPRAFSDWDEPLYLSLAYASAELPFRTIVPTNGVLPEAYRLLDTQVPHALTDLVLGHILKFFGWRPAYAALVLDIICVVVSYLLFTWLFQAIFAETKNRNGELAAACSVALPWLFSLGEIFNIIIPGVSSLTTVSHTFFPSVPAVRGLHTQIGFVFFCAVASIFINCLARNRWSLVSALLVGIISGLSIYAYFFAWGAGIALIGSTLFFATLFRLVQLPRALPWFIVCLLVSGSLSVPGLAVLFSGGELYSPGAAPLASLRLLNIGKYWFFSPIDLLLGALAIIALFRSSNEQKGLRLSALLILSIGTSTFVLMNLQPVLGRWVTPYHFSLFFLHPVLSGIGTLLLFNLVFRRPQFKVLARLILLALIGGSAVHATFSALAESRRHTDEVAMIRFLRNLPEGAKIVSPPFDPQKLSAVGAPIYEVLPYWIEALAQRESLSKFMGFDTKRESFVGREIMHGLLYHGSPGMFSPCDAVRPSATSDILIGTQAYLAAQRFVDCELGAVMLQTKDYCRFVEDFLASYLIADQAFAVTEKVLSQNSDQIWKSPNGEFSIGKLNSSTAAKIRLLCSQ